MWSTFHLPTYAKVRVHADVTCSKLLMDPLCVICTWKNTFNYTDTQWSHICPTSVSVLHYITDRLLLCILYYTSIHFAWSFNFGCEQRMRLMSHRHRKCYWQLSVMWPSLYMSYSPWWISLIGSICWPACHLNSPNLHIETQSQCRQNQENAI